ncbi:MAG: prolyl oligopeptidase family serine peptidase [Pseudomonadota bacterium]
MKNLHKSNIYYPQARMDSEVVDNFHGTLVKDPYRWLEDHDSAETKEWIEKQNQISKKFIEDGDTKEKLTKRLSKIWNYPKYSSPIKKNETYFYFKNNGLQDQSVMYMTKDFVNEKILLDPNALSKDGTIALTEFAISPDAKYIAYLTSASGSDWQTLYLINTETLQDETDLLKWCRFTEIAWTHDNKGFFYNRYLKSEDKTFDYNAIFYHVLGTNQDHDKLIYSDPKNKDLVYSPEISSDGEYILINAEAGTDPNNMYFIKKIALEGDFRHLLGKGRALYHFLGNDAETFYFVTNLNADRAKVIAVDLNNPDPKNFITIIHETEDAIDEEFSKIINNKFVITYKHHAYHIIKIYDKNGKFENEIALPAIGSITALNGSEKDEAAYLTFESFLLPETIYKYDFTKNELSVHKEVKIDFDSDKFETKQVFYKSKDGTIVPMFLTYKKGIKLDSSNPTLLYGYGGFNVSKTPIFKAGHLVFLEAGGIYAQASIRGGDEYGEKWHTDGMLQNKQNVFDDFIAGAEFLIKNNYTTMEKLAILGGSNGGLLTAACMLQKPELFGAVISNVGVLDMLRYHKFTIGYYWIPEYGDPDNPEHFKFLYKYSPLHNIKENVAYPPLLVMTADHDDRVDPAHSKKFIATLNEKYNGPNPILLRVEFKAGHGKGKPTSKAIEEYADMYSFIYKTLDIDY